MQFDFKITTWERITVEPKDEQKVLDAIKSGEIKTANDIFVFLEDNKCNEPSRDLLFETEVPMSLEENSGYSTIDVLDEDGNHIYQNGK